MVQLLDTIRMPPILSRLSLAVIARSNVLVFWVVVGIDDVVEILFFDLHEQKLNIITIRKKSVNTLANIFI